ncbi:MAG: hypothetical protein KDH15_21870 [Rhodocyclaceae bacterium]|nr:hypothetical protein [Rhodocyclaceae bacterium]
MDIASAPTTADAALRAHVVARAGELGGVPPAAAIDIDCPPLPTPPGTSLFRAAWQDAEGERALTGLVAGERIVSHTLDAIAAWFDGWRTDAVVLPDADAAARACAFLLDADRRHRLVLAAGDPAAAQLAPAYRGRGGGLPLEFHWRDRHGRLACVRIAAGADGRWRYDIHPVVHGHRGDRRGIAGGEGR